MPSPRRMVADSHGLVRKRAAADVATEYSIHVGEYRAATHDAQTIRKVAAGSPGRKADSKLSGSPESIRNALYS